MGLRYGQRCRYIPCNPKGAARAAATEDANMASITSAGIGSGLNVTELVGQLVAAERAPAENRLKAMETSTKAQISAFGAIKAALAGFESALKKLDGAGGLPGRKATVGTDAGFTASAGSSAALGTYSIIVEKLATAHKLQSAAATSTTQVGDGTLTLKVGDGDAFDVTIEAGKGTLADIRDAINAQAAGNGRERHAGQRRRPGRCWC